MDRILLIEMDKEYGCVLAKAISGLHKEFEITIINQEIDLIDGVILHQSWDDFNLILIGGYPDEIVEAFLKKDSKHKKIVVLTEYRTQNVILQSQKSDRRVWYLYKYVKINDMIADLDFILGHITGKKNFSRKSAAANMIGFFSISGGTGKSVLSIGTARELSRYHDKKVLYLSFEEMPASELFICNNANNKNISDYLYYLFEKKDENLCSRLSGFVSSDDFGVETFCPSNGRNDLKYLSTEELVYFIKNILDSCRYDYLIFDLSSDLSEETLLLMDQCIKIVLIERDCPVSKYKNNKLTAYLNKISSIPFGDRFLSVVNKENRYNNEVSMEEPDHFDSKYRKKIHIEKDDNSFYCTRNHLEINMNHAFGVGMKKIADEILSSEKKERQ